MRLSGALLGITPWRVNLFQTFTVRAVNDSWVGWFTAGATLSSRGGSGSHQVTPQCDIRTSHPR